MMVIMALVTTFMTTPLLKVVYPKSELEKEREAATASDLAERETKFTVLLCVEGDQSGPALVTLAKALVAENPHRHSLYALQLTRPGNRTSFCIVGHEENSCLQALDPLLARAEQVGLEVHPIAYVASQPAREICSVAKAKKADLVLLGLHQSAVTGTVLGGTVADVLEDACANVSVFVDRGLKTVKRILLPVHDTSNDRATLALAHRMTAAKATVTLLQVVDPERPADEKAAREWESDRSYLEEGHWHHGTVRKKLVRHAKPAVAAVEEAKEGYDLMIIGAGHPWGLERRFLGLAPEFLVAECPISLLLVQEYHSPKHTAWGAPG
jgi:nucleotide-binding universal stress UspA family protein